MPAWSFVTAGDGKQHLFAEKLGTQIVDNRRYRVTIRNDAYNEAGTSMVSGSGPLGILIDETFGCVLVAPQTTAVDSITIKNCNLSKIGWNDFSKTCQIAVVWGDERD